MKRNMRVLCSVMMLLAVFLVAGLPAVVADDAAAITIDIKPCREVNVLNVNVRGWLPVAIQGEGWSDVIPETVELEGLPALEWRVKEDYLLVKFDAAAVIDTLGEVADGDVRKLCITGELNEDMTFEACDTVEILKRGRR